jgi:putative transposase
MGCVAASTWSGLAEHHPRVVLDAWVVMPDHLHGIVALMGGQTPALPVGVVAWRARPVSAGNPESMPRQTGPTPRSLGAFVGAFKSATTKRIKLLRATPGAPVWQRGFHERIIGDTTTLTNLRRYIANNPLRWSNAEPLHPSHFTRNRGLVIPDGY